MSLTILDIFPKKSAIRFLDKGKRRNQNGIPNPKT